MMSSLGLNGWGRLALLLGFSSVLSNVRGAHANDTALAVSVATHARPDNARRTEVFVPFGPTSVGGTDHYSYRFEGHVHTAYSPDARHRVLDVLGAAEELGLDALIITDHGGSAAQSEFANYHGKLLPFVGREIGGDFGHALFWNVTADDSHTKSTLSQRARFAHKHDGLLIFAHPGWWIEGNGRDPMEWMSVQAMRRGGIAGDVDAIELWNGVYRTPLPRLINAWVKLLEAGVYVPIVGNSDFHNFAMHQLGHAHNLAFCERPEPASCLWSAVREGRLVITDGPAAALSVNGKLPGSIVDPAGAALKVAIDALAPDGGTLRVYLGKQVVRTVELTPGVRSRSDFELAAPGADTFVRMDIARPQPHSVAQTPVSLLSNPVLIDVGEPRSWR
ncbi:MAG TPA: CehA/McbA family metallohydrolase [Polyangiales bacterium]|nr:CehA/McbA family metallohydrolase [Polyangiales bacterium]